MTHANKVYEYRSIPLKVNQNVLEDIKPCAYEARSVQWARLNAMYVPLGLVTSSEEYGQARIYIVGCFFTRIKKTRKRNENKLE